MILDLGLPDIDGMDLIRELRLVTSAPVIVLSGRTGPGDKIGALDAGADDYVTKPFSMEELLARLRAALRRDAPVAPGRPVAIGRSTVDLAAHLATRDGQQIRLTPTEWRLLEILIRHPGQLVGGRRMLTEVWGPAYQRSTHYLRFHMAGLRRKLEDDPARPSPADRARYGLPLLALITARRRGGHNVTRVSLEGERQHHGRAGARAAPDLPGRGGGRREDL